MGGGEVPPLVFDSLAAGVYRDPTRVQDARGVLFCLFCLSPEGKQTGSSGSVRWWLVDGDVPRFSGWGQVRLGAGARSRCPRRPPLARAVSLTSPRITLSALSLSLLVRPPSIEYSPFGKEHREHFTERSGVVRGAAFGDGGRSGTGSARTGHCERATLGEGRWRGSRSWSARRREPRCGATWKKTSR